MTEADRPNTQVDQEVEPHGSPRLTPIVAQDGEHEGEIQPRTPLPKFQLFLVLLIHFSEPITAVVIYPFVNQFVRETGITKGDDKKTGYYAGVIESVFFLAEAATVFQWGWLSDRLGRRPILLLGPLGLTFAMLSFGYSTSFWIMLLSRFFQGVFNGNIGVSKAVIIELTDSSSIGDALALIPPMWSTGITVGPMLGGVLSSPAERWPNVFGKIALFKDHPYFLPCLAAGAISFFAFTHPSHTASKHLTNGGEQRRGSEISRTSSTDSLLGHNDHPDYGTAATTRSSSSASSEAFTDSCQGPSNSNLEAATLRSVLSSKIMQLILINYIFQAFSQMSFAVLMPLMFSTSIEDGGLAFNPYQIGLIMGIWGCFNALIQINLFGKAIRKYGGASVYRAACISYLIVFMAFPLSNYLARRNGSVGFGTWVVIVIQLFSRIFASTGYGSIQVIIAESTPKSILGSVNGLAQMTACIMRTIAPIIASSLFSVSIQGQILGGYMVYVVIYAILLAAVGFSGRLIDAVAKEKST
ncbi:hypothetical protein D9756_003059 [Leucocoprinus leucothites]|uniref:Major facilitator superfamily (MFS) profile domain-containing protein n=1 Tax=Leucocoprinus leucothites TaxID=201217 RepID=A0A8H5G6M0_9AGAR|nr:hypothetical protein D9756_003059 [Leucoagaricus leucothites]